MYVAHIHACFPEKKKKKVSDPGTGGIDGSELLSRWWELNLALCKSGKCSLLLSHFLRPRICVL